MNTTTFEGLKIARNFWYLKCLYYVDEELRGKKHLIVRTWSVKTAHEEHDKSYVR